MNRLKINDLEKSIKDTIRWLKVTRIFASIAAFLAIVALVLAFTACRDCHDHSPAEGIPAEAISVDAGIGCDQCAPKSPSPPRPTITIDPWTGVPSIKWGF